MHECYADENALSAHKTPINARLMLKERSSHIWKLDFAIITGEIPALDNLDAKNEASNAKFLNDGVSIEDYIL